MSSSVITTPQQQNCITQCVSTNDCLTTTYSARCMRECSQQCVATENFVVNLKSNDGSKPNSNPMTNPTSGQSKPTKMK